MTREKSAGLVIFRIDDGEPRFLLLHYGWGHWGFPKGNIETGETARDAAIRETKEETGLINFNFVDDFQEMIYYFYHKDEKTIHKEVIYFLAETTDSEVILSFEHKGYKWLHFNDALSKLSFKNEKEILKKVKKNIQKYVASSRRER